MLYKHTHNNEMAAAAVAEEMKPVVAGAEGLKVPGEILPQLTTADQDLADKGGAISLGGLRPSEMNSIILPELHSLTYGQTLKEEALAFGGTLQAQYTPGMMSAGIAVTMTLTRTLLGDVAAQLGWGLAAIEQLTLNLGTNLQYTGNTLLVRYLQEPGDSHKSNALMYAAGPPIDGDFSTWSHNPTATVLLWYPGVTLNSKGTPPYDTQFFGGASSVLNIKFQTKDRFLSGNGVAALTSFQNVVLQEFFLDFKHDSSKIGMNMPGPTLPYHELVERDVTGGTWDPVPGGVHTVTFNAFDTVGLEYMYMLVRQTRNLTNSDVTNSTTISPFLFEPVGNISVRMGSNIIYQGPGWTGPQAIAAKMSDGDYRFVGTELNGPHNTGPFILKPTMHWLTTLPRSLVQELANLGIKTNVVNEFAHQMSITFQINAHGVNYTRNMVLVLQYKKALKKVGASVRIV